MHLRKYKINEREIFVFAYINILKNILDILFVIISVNNTGSKIYFNKFYSLLWIYYFHKE